MAATGFANKFHWADYLVFAANLLISAGIGFYYGCRGQKTTKDFLVGGRSMSALPVSLSLLASFLSAPFLMGVPAELYSFGAMYMMIVFGQIFSCIITAYTFVPIFHNMELTSAYETLYMAVVIYAPSMAFEPVTGLPTWASILATGLVCTFYTAVGGMKAVVWADVVQMIIIFIGCMVLVIMGSIRAGGLDDVFVKAYEGGRLDFNNFSPDPTERHTFWTQVIGGFLAVSSILSSNQVTIQRYLSIGKLSDVRRCLWYCIAFIIISNCFVFILGFVLYAVYGSCDPMTSGLIGSRDQLVPMFVMDVLGKIRGIPGLFAAAVFAATLSTVSSGLNALAAVILLDMVKPAYKKITKTNLTEEASTRLSKGLAAGMGFVVIGLAYVVPFFGPTILMIALALFGMIGGPLLGLFTLAIFVPMCNWKGALAGLTTSLLCTSWIAIGGIVYPNRPISLPVRLDGCPLDDALNSTLYYNTTQEMVTSPIFMSSALQTSALTAPPIAEYGGIWIYKISYMWLSTISVIIALGVGITVSLITGKQEKVDPSLVISWAMVGEDIKESIRDAKDGIVDLICCRKFQNTSKEEDTEIKLEYMDEKEPLNEDHYDVNMNDMNGFLVEKDRLVPTQYSRGRHLQNGGQSNRRSVHWNGPEVLWNETYLSSM